MKFVLGALIGLVLGAIASTIAVATLSGCSCPPGYKPRVIAPGTYAIEENMDAGTQSGVITFDATTGTHTFTGTTGIWRVSYRIVGAR